MVEESFPSAEGFKQATEDLPGERTGVSRDPESVLGTLGAPQTQVCTICDPSWLGELGSHQLCFPGGHCLAWAWGLSIIDCAAGGTCLLAAGWGSASAGAGHGQVQALLLCN